MEVIHEVIHVYEERKKTNIQVKRLNCTSKTLRSGGCEFAQRITTKIYKELKAKCVCLPFS